MKKNIFLFLFLPVMAQADNVSLTTEELNTAAKIYDQSTLVGRASMTFEEVLKKKNISLPVCENFFVEESIAKCRNYKCIKKIVFSNIPMVEEIIIKPKAENKNVCEILTPERGYKIEKSNWATFGRMYLPQFHVSQDDSYNLHAEVGTAGYADRSPRYVYKSKDCHYRVRYKFKLHKANTTQDSEIKTTKNGVSEASTNGKKRLVYTENGISFKAADPTKPVLFHASVESFLPDVKNHILCAELNPVLPFSLEKAGMVEFFKPIN